MLCCPQSKRLVEGVLRHQGSRGLASGFQSPWDNRKQAPTLDSYQSQLEILDAVADGIVARDGNGAIVYANDAGARALGFESAADLLDASPQETWARYEVIDLRGAEPHGLPSLELGDDREIVIRVESEEGDERLSVVRSRHVLDERGLVRFAVGVFQDVTERRRAEQERAALLAEAEAARAEAESSAENLWAVHQVTDIALSGLRLDELLDALLERVCDALRLDLSVIMLMSDGRELHLRAARGFEEGSPEDVAIPLGEGIAGQIAATRRPFVSEQLSADDPAGPWLRHSGAVSLAGVPLVVDDHVLGVLVVGNRVGRSFQQRELGVLHLVADRMGFAIERARLFDAEHRALGQAELAVERLGRLLSVTAALSQAVTPDEVSSVIIDQGLAAMGAVSGSVALIGTDGITVEVTDSKGYSPKLLETWGSFDVEANVPLAEAVRTKQLIIVPTVDALQSRYPHISVDNGHRSFAAIPLLTEGRALGALGLSFHTEVDFSPVERTFMVSLGQQCAQAMQRAMLYETAQSARAEAEKAHERISFLARASEMLGASLDYRKTLEEVARLAITRVSDWCVIEMAEEGNGQQVTVAHGQPAKLQVAHELRTHYPASPDAPTGSTAVIRSGEPELYSHITEEMLSKAARDERHLELMKELGLESIMILPLKARGRILGTITFASSRTDRRFGDEDLLFAQDLARRAATAIDNSRLFSEMQESKERFAYLARALQSSLLPQIPDIEGVETGVRYRAAAEGTQVGGDFYDLFETSPGELTVVMGDVCGKGARAAALTGLARHTIRAVATMEPSPSAILDHLNGAILREGEGEVAPKFATVSYGRLELIDTGARLTVASGGHPLPLVVRSNGRIERVGIPGLLLGVFEDAELSEQTVELSPGDAIVFFTDGVTEARRGVEVFGDRRLEQVLSARVGATAEQTAEAIERAVVAFSDDGPSDDVAVLVLRIEK